MNEKTKFNINQHLVKLGALQPLPITFNGKVRLVHYFHRGTAEAFTDALRGKSENESMKRRKQREVCLLAIVLADLNGSFPHFMRLKRWIWRKRLEHSRYSDVEAVALLDAAVERIQNGKQLDALCAIIMAQMQTLIASMSANRKQIEDFENEKRKEWNHE